MKEQMRSKKEQKKIERKLLLFIDYLFLFYIIIVLFLLFRAFEREAPFCVSTLHLRRVTLHD